MERLTARSPKNNMAYLVNVKDDEQELEGAYNTLVCLKESFELLAKYEDTGLTPEEVQKIAKAKSEGRLVAVVHGQWISQRRCSVCENMYFGYDDPIKKFKYCPNCGAKMDAEAAAHKRDLMELYRS